MIWDCLLIMDGGCRQLIQYDVLTIFFYPDSNKDFSVSIIMVEDDPGQYIDHMMTTSIPYPSSCVDPYILFYKF